MSIKDGALVEGAIHHVERDSLPWRRERITECGKLTAGVAAHVTYDEAVALVRKHGQRRAALLLCMTCAERMETHRRRMSWEEEEADAEHKAPWLLVQRDDHGPGRALLKNELRALIALFQLHEEEFFSILDGDAAREEWRLRGKRSKRGDAL